MANIDALTQRGFKSYSTITVNNLCKPYHDVIIFPFNFHLKSWEDKQEEENYKKFTYLDDEKSSFGEAKAYCIIFWGLSFGSMKTILYFGLPPRDSNIESRNWLK